MQLLRRGFPKRSVIDYFGENKYYVTPPMVVGGVCAYLAFIRKVCYFKANAPYTL